MIAKHHSFVPGSQPGPVSRREALKSGILGTAGLLLAERLAIGGEPKATSAAAAAPASGPAPKSPAAGPAKAKAVIQIWM